MRAKLQIANAKGAVFTAEFTAVEGNVPYWRNCAGLMRFDRLDGAGPHLEAAFTVAYRLTNDGAEMWSARLNKFKNKERSAFAGAASVMSAATSPLLRELNLEPARVLFVPALASRETKAEEKGWLPTLARYIANQAGCNSDHTVLRKNAHRSIHTLGGAIARDEELDKANYRATRDCGRIVFVVDDFITRGSTLSKIGEAIKAVRGDCKVYGLALGKTDRTGFVTGMINGRPNDHVPPKWSEAWKRGEQLFKDRQARGDR